MNYKEYLIDYFNPIPGRLHDSGVKIMLQIKENSIGIGLNYSRGGLVIGGW